jgi:outer membrane immunogenic protein
VTYQNKLPWFGTFRGRLGFTPAERWLVYATGGLAYGEVTTSETLNVNGASVAFSTNRTKLGWTVGAGVEAALWSNWTAKLEYLYVDFGTVNDTLIGIAPITPVVTGTRVTDQIVRVGLNYRFGGPFVARY